MASNKNKPAAAKKAAEEQPKQEPAAPAEQVAAAPAAPAAAVPAPKVEKPLHHKIGELVYYEDPKYTMGAVQEMIHFEDLPEDERAVWFERGFQFLEAVDKLNLAIVSKTAVEQTKINLNVDRQALRKTIQTFVNSLNTTKKELFPVDELVHRIAGPA